MMFPPFPAGPMPTPRLPAPTPIQLDLDPETLALQVKVGPQGKVHVMSTDELIRFAAGRCGRY